MDIGYRVGCGSAPHMTELAGFAVTLTGLTENAAHGPSALRGTPVLAETSGWEGPVPEGMTYQWHSQADGPLAGATEASFVPDATLADESVIYCVVSVPEQGSRASAPVVLREAVPQAAATLFDEVFDVGTGPQIVASAAAFLGQNLRYSVTGTGAEIDPVTGDISISTDVERDGDIIAVSATNSGGTASAAFQVTVEDIAVEGAIPFGALTPAGAGGVPVGAAAITDGDPAGHWQIVGGLLTPTASGEGALAGVYSLELDGGEILDVMTVPDKASARVDEIATVYNALPLTARGLMVQDGDGRALGRIRLDPKVFEREMVLEPTNWLEDTDTRQSLRPVTLAALAIGGSSDGTQYTENLTVQGFEFQMEGGGLLPSNMQTGAGTEREGDGNIGIVLIERPSRHVTIRHNEIWSRMLRDIVEADDFRNNVRTSRQMRGISTKRNTAHVNGTNEHVQIEDNYIHDCSRGASLVATGHYEGVRSRFCGNIIEDCYTNFFTAGFLNGLDIFDNLCMGVYAANGDTLGAIPASSPHSACGGSFDAGGSQSSANITLMGNLFHTGWKRTQIHEELGLPKPDIGATGVKFNDPGAADSYWNLIVAFNTVISHGICMEMSGAGADTYIDVFNNTLASENYAGVGSGPVYYFSGAENVRLFNNIGTSYVIGSEDGTSFFARTLDTLQGYGNLTINTGNASAFGELAYFVGDPQKGLELLSIDEALSAYVPKPDQGAMTAVQKKGALGTGYYAGNGVHAETFDPPRAIGGTGDIPPLTLWDGSVHLERPDGLTNLSTYRFRSFLFAWEGEIDASVAAQGFHLISFPNSYFFIRCLPSGAIQVSGKHASSGQFLQALSGFRISPEDGLVRIAVSYDMETGRLQLVKNGEIDNFTRVTVLEFADRMHFGGSLLRVGADQFGQSKFAGTFGRAYFQPTEDFFDLETDAGLSALFASDGYFRDWGADGALVTGDAPMVYLRGTSASLMNLGIGGPFAARGGTIIE